MRIRLLLLAAVLSTSLVASTRAQQGPKVLLLYDMEGVTDARGPQAVEMGSQTYPATRESLTEDVNAAIRGLFKAGAREIVLTDGHGSGTRASRRDRTRPSWLQVSGGCLDLEGARYVHERLSR